MRSPGSCRTSTTASCWLRPGGGRRRAGPSSLAKLAGEVGLVFANPFNQITGARFTVREEVAFGLENLGVPRDEMLPRDRGGPGAGRAERVADRSPYALSGGQQQRVAIASVIVMRPKVLVLDEPTSQLDPVGTREVFETLHGWLRRAAPLSSWPSRSWNGSPSTPTGSSCCPEAASCATACRATCWPTPRWRSSALRPHATPRPHDWRPSVVWLRQIAPMPVTWSKRFDVLRDTPTSDHHLGQHVSRSTQHVSRSTPIAYEHHISDLHFTYPTGVEACGA